jgi:ferrochelatase
MSKIRAKKTAYIIVNFGGPRDLGEVEEFLIALLTDQEVIQTSLPACLHHLLFRRVAKKRAQTVIQDYAKIGGKSPIYEDTEQLAQRIREEMQAPVLTFHRYLPKTHKGFLEAVSGLCDCERICVFPLFPQFSYATTGSIALWFAKHLPRGIQDKLQWVKSYPDHAAYVEAFVSVIQERLEQLRFMEQETLLLFSAHGLPKEYVAKGDVYEQECEATFRQLEAHFPKALSRLCYQSQFGKKEWLRPYTNEVCKDIAEWGKGYSNVLIVPLSFTSDHIETLFEVEELYIPILRDGGWNAARCPALNLRADWIRAIVQIVGSESCLGNDSLIRLSL